MEERYKKHISDMHLKLIESEIEHGADPSFRKVKGAVKVEYEDGYKEYHYKGFYIRYDEDRPYHKYHCVDGFYETLSDAVEAAGRAATMYGDSA